MQDPPSTCWRASFTSSYTFLSLDTSSWCVMRPAHTRDCMGLCGIVLSPLVSCECV